MSEKIIDVLLTTKPAERETNLRTLNLKLVNVFLFSAGATMAEMFTEDPETTSLLMGNVCRRFILQPDFENIRILQKLIESFPQTGDWDKSSIYKLLERTKESAEQLLA